MYAKQKGLTLHSLQDLGQVALVPPPELPEIQIGEFDDLETQAQKIGERAAQVRSWVLSTMGKLERAKGLSRIAQELAAENIAAAQKSLQEFVSHPVPAYCRAAWLGLLEYELTRELNSREEVLTFLGRLVNEGYLKEEPTGPLKGYGKTYAISENSRFGDEEVEEVKKLLSVLFSRVYAEVGKTRAQKAQALKDRATITRQELFAGQPGFAVLEVPAQEVVQNGQTRWRGGGVLLVHSNGQSIFPREASGAIEAAIQEAKELRVSLLVKSLAQQSPPFDQRLPLDQNKKAQFLWYILKRTFRAEEEAEKIRTSWEQLDAEATISPKEFFLERQPGICLVEFQGVWRTPTPDGRTAQEIPHLFFLIERRRIEEEGTAIQIVKVPDHLGAFFASCMGKYTEGPPKFEGLQYPLNAVLQAVHGQVFHASQDARKIVLITTSGK